MMPTVNLYIDRMNAVEPVRVADVYSATQNHASNYREAAAKIGLTTREYAEFRQALTGGGAAFVRLPRRIDEMAGVHRNGRVYALKNVVVPEGTMGWTVNLADGVQVIVPQICSNLSMNHSHGLAVAPPPRAYKVKQGKRVAAGRFVHPTPVAIQETPVVFSPPAVAVVPLGSGASDYAAAPAAAVGGGGAAGAGHSGLPFLGLLAPIIGAFASHGGSGGSGGSTPPAPAPVAKCSSGSNDMGVCQQ